MNAMNSMFQNPAFQNVSFVSQFCRSVLHARDLGCSGFIVCCMRGRRSSPALPHGGQGRQTADSCAEPRVSLADGQQSDEQPRVQAAHGRYDEVRPTRNPRHAQSDHWASVFPLICMHPYTCSVAPHSSILTHLRLCARTSLFARLRVRAFFLFFFSFSGTKRSCRSMLRLAKRCAQTSSVFFLRKKWRLFVCCVYTRYHSSLGAHLTTFMPGFSRSRGAVNEALPRKLPYWKRSKGVGLSVCNPQLLAKTVQGAVD